MSKDKERHYRYCWDTTVFLAWLNKEASAPQSDIEAILNEVYANRSTLILSVVTYTEILTAKHSRRQRDAWESFLKRSSVLRVDVTFPIAQKAEEIRSRALTMGPKGEQRKIRTPDAQIIATAIVQQADFFHSLEPKHHSLSGSPIVDGIRISPPCLGTRQKTMFPPAD
jgi:predicted nucleic acid-binding protein